MNTILVRHIYGSLSTSFFVYAVTGYSGFALLAYIAIKTFVFSLLFQYFAIHPTLRRLSVLKAKKVLLFLTLLAGILSVVSLYYLSQFDWLQNQDTLQYDLIRRTTLFTITAALFTATAAAVLHGMAASKK